MKTVWIEPNMLLVGERPLYVSDLQNLYLKHVRAIITLMEKPLGDQPGLNRAVLGAVEMTSLHLAIQENFPPTAEQVAQAAHFIDEMYGQGKIVYMHCKNGIHRSGTMLHALFVTYGYNLPEAKEKVAQLRPASAYKNLTNPQKDFLTAFALRMTKQTRH
ncbi:MAG: hypothetical protein GYB68_06710 [Chloroflexi bacterium]|nr:hypothetical protein [Chloroflexota bacterium]